MATPLPLPDDDAVTLDLPPLDRPGARDADQASADEDEPLVGEDAQTPLAGDDDIATVPNDDEDALAMLDGGLEEPTALGDDAAGFAGSSGDEGLALTEGEPSFLGAEELLSDDEETALDEGLALGDDDGGIEGLDAPAEEAIDELPPLDGQRDDEDDEDVVDDAIERELGLTR